MLRSTVHFLLLSGLLSPHLSCSAIRNCWVVSKYIWVPSKYYYIALFHSVNSWVYQKHWGFLSVICGSIKSIGGHIVYGMGGSNTCVISRVFNGKRKPTSDDDIIWPPTVIIENTRLAKTDDGRWTGIGNAEMAQILRDIGHTFGRPKSAWGKEGHRGQVLVRYQPTLEGLKEAERLHEHFKANARGRDEWGRVHPLWHGLPGHEGLEEGPDFVRVDEETNQQKRVLYGYLAVVSDMHKVPKKKKQRWCMTVSKKDLEAKEASQIKPQAPLSI
eukprot:Gb_15253 [translate_table: standard]